jgi:hypothetical protein
MTISLARITLLGLVTALAACSTNPVQVRVDQDPAHSVASYGTFGFFDQQGTDSARYSTLLTAHLKESTRQQMEARGYVYSEQQPQLLVNFGANVRQYQEIHASVPVGGYYGVRAAYRGWGGASVDTVTTRQGTLTIDLVDASTNSLIWRGIGEGVMSAEAARNTGPTVSAAVTEILQGLPSRQVASR